ncbi:MAG: hypothetical protein M3174_00680, partial [Actinomycetota bacterium]|nr:hypothetical protein [Actinomycetota bacterium]
MMRRVLVAWFIVASVSALALPAAAGWLIDSAGEGYGKARSMPLVAAPSVNVAGRNVTVTWSKAAFPDGTDVQDYRVARYNTSGVVQGIGFGCESFVTGLSCTEAAAPPGDWRYTITPRHGNWTGAESPRSVTARVAAPALAFTSPTTVASLPAVLNGSISGFRTGKSVIFRLDDPTTGTTLTSNTTPPTIPNSGAASFSVTLPKGTGNGPRTVYAVDGSGESASAAINVAVPAPTPTSLTTTNAGGNAGRGRIAQGDSFQVTYSEALDVASLCSTWAGDTTNQSLNTDNALTIRVNNNASLLGNDTVTIAAAPGTCGGAFNFGTVDLGGPGFVLGDATFAGAGAGRSSLTWTPSTRTLSVTFGALATGGAPA